MQHNEPYDSQTLNLWCAEICKMVRTMFANCPSVLSGDQIDHNPEGDNLATEVFVA